jgi:hypothetical protein
MTGEDKDETNKKRLKEKLSRKIKIAEERENEENNIKREEKRNGGVETGGIRELKQENNIKIMRRRKWLKRKTMHTRKLKIWNRKYINQGIRECLFLISGRDKLQTPW